MTMKPTFIAYTVKNRGRSRSPIWIKIGAAFQHERGSGLNIELNALPLDGKIVLIEPKADDSAAGAEGAEGAEGGEE